MTTVLVIKTGALGDVLRTTAILPGLRERFPDARVTWLTAAAAEPLVASHPLIDRVLTCKVKDAASMASAQAAVVDTRWDWVLSLDDELPLCALAHALDTARLSGASLDEQGERVYTDDVEPWFGMGLLARDGKQAADRRKVENERTHPAIYAEMLGISEGRPQLPLGEAEVGAAQTFAREHGLFADRPLIGLNTGAGARWVSKGLPVERVVAYAAQLAAALEGPVDFLVLGGPDESARNAEILAGIATLGGDVRAIDPGTDNDLLGFTALVGLCDLLLTSDSLALHLGIATNTRIVSFFAPTSAAEIELYGLGEKVVSTAADYCSYRPDADNDTITPERLVEATRRVLELAPGPRAVPRPATADA